MHQVWTSGTPAFGEGAADGGLAERTSSAERPCGPPPQFHIDLDDQGRHVTRISYTVDGEAQWVEDVERPGRSATEDSALEQDGYKYVVSAQRPRHARPRCARCAPKPLPTEKWVSPICPPVLRHLRQKRAVRESDAAREYEVHDRPLEVGAELDDDPQQGLSATVGYRVPDQPDLIPEPDLQIEPDGRLCPRSASAFSRSRRGLSETARRWLYTGRQREPHLTASPSF